MFKVSALSMAVLAAGIQQASAQVFQIEGIDFGTSAYLSDEELGAVSRNYVKKPIEFEDLNKLLDEVERLYLVAGILTAKPIIPPQEIADGILHVELVEAKIDRVDTSALAATKPEFFERNLRLAVDELPNYDLLEEDLRYFDIMHDFSPSVSFVPGARTATTTAVLGGNEPPKWSGQISLDNFGREETGFERLSFVGRWASVTGWRDTLALQLQGSEGAYTGNINYSYPLGVKGGRLQGGLGMSQSNIIQGSFAPIDIVSDSSNASVSYRWPWRVTAHSHWVFDAGLNYETTSSEVMSVPLADFDIVELNFLANWSQRIDAAVQTAAVGLRIGNADSNEVSQTEGSYQLIYGNFGYSRPFGERMLLDGQISWQLAPDQNLPVARLFSVGGPNTLRGYTNNLRSGDSGASLRLQATAREAWRFYEGKGLVRPFGFVDTAMVLPYRETGAAFVKDQDLLLSVGGGLSLAWGTEVTGSVLLAVPLLDTLGFETSGDPRGFIGLDYKF